MRRFLSVLRVAITAVAIAVGVEGGYRIYLYLKHPNYFITPSVDGAEFSVYDKSPWQYDPDYGYGYVPALKVDVTALKAGMVTGCADMTVANAQGNSGPPVPDFDEADVKIAIFGDSFTSAPVAGPAWTKMLGEKLERELGKTVRVLNLGRDGYGLPRMLALANGKLKDVRPSLAIFAFHGTAVDRAPYWRSVVGTGDDVRVYTSLENSPNPNPADAADGVIVLPSATRAWCEEHLRKSPDERRNDPVLQKLLSKHREIAIKNGPPTADLLDWQTSYVYGVVRYRSPFRAQWGRMLPSTIPVVTYDDYRNDPKVMTDLAGVMKSGVPFMFVHLAVGTAISEGREFDLDRRARNLMDSLRNITGAEIYKTTDFVTLPREEALKMCRAPYDCHPSELGMEVYGQAVAKMVLKSGFR